MVVIWNHHHFLATLKYAWTRIDFVDISKLLIGTAIEWWLINFPEMTVITCVGAPSWPEKLNIILVWPYSSTLHISALPFLQKKDKSVQLESRTRLEEVDKQLVTHILYDDSSPFAKTKSLWPCGAFEAHSFYHPNNCYLSKAEILALVCGCLYQYFCPAMVYFCEA